LFTSLCDAELLAVYSICFIYLVSLSLLYIIMLCCVAGLIAFVVMFGCLYFVGYSQKVN